MWQWGVRLQLKGDKVGVSAGSEKFTTEQELELGRTWDSNIAGFSTSYQHDPQAAKEFETRVTPLASGGQRQVHCIAKRLQS